MNGAFMAASHIMGGPFGGHGSPLTDIASYDHGDLLLTLGDSSIRIEDYRHLDRGGF